MYNKPVVAPYRLYTIKNPAHTFYAEYTKGGLQLAGEFRRDVKVSWFTAPTGAHIPGEENARGGYLSAAYRFSKHVEVGTYHSRFIANWSLYHGDPMNHVFDQAVTARFDVSHYLDLKVEGHFIDGAMINSALDRGFYASVNPNGVKPSTNLLVIRLGYHM
jgi:hypothetical protein